jgi:hypothetical protein
MRRICLLVLLPTVLAPLLVATPAPAAGKSCNVEAIIAEAYRSATVSDGYSVSCLRKAQIAAANDVDIATYSNVDQVLRQAIVKAGGKPQPIPQTPTAPETGSSGSGSGTSGSDSRSGTGTTTRPTRTKTATPSSVVLVDKPKGDSGGVPAPVIALGAVAVAAVVAAGVVELRRRRA